MRTFDELWAIVAPAIWETFYMVFTSGIMAVLLGLPLAILLYTTNDNGLRPNKAVYRVLDFLVNIGRSLPFAILLVLVLPLSKFLVGTRIGAIATIPPLTIAAIPFLARLIEEGFLAVDRGIIEAAQSMGSSYGVIIFRVLIPETLPTIVRCVTNMLINLIAYSAMAGMIGGGGLGNLAITYGYQRREVDILLISCVAIIIFVQGIQFIGSKIADYIDHA